PACRHVARGCLDRFAERDRRFRVGLALDLGTARAGDRPGDAADVQQPGVGRVRDRVDVEPGDVRLQHFQLRHVASLTRAVSDVRSELAQLFRGQAGWCAKLGSPLYAHLIDRAADDLEAGGPVWRVVEPYADRPLNYAHHLRMMGATHRLALAGEAPELAAHYPSTGGDGDADAAWSALIDLITEREISLDQAVQTNEVGRSAALLGGF